MITTAAFILGEAYMDAHVEDYDPDGFGILLFLALFMAFDWHLVEVIAA